MSHITPAELELWQRSGFAFELLDVRRDIARTKDGSEIAGSHWQDPALWLDWKDAVAHDKPVVVYCAHGHEIGQGLCAALRAMGADARYLQGGMTGWKEAGLATIPHGESS